MPLFPRAIAKLLLIINVGALALLSSVQLAAQPANWVYLVDTRPPSDVFQNGFTTDGTVLSLLALLSGGACEADDAEQRSAWLSTSSNEQLVQSFALSQLRRRRVAQQPGSSVVGVWIYAVHTDSSYYSVLDIFNQVRQAGLNNSHGYTPTDAALVSRFLSNATAVPISQVLTHHVDPRNIYHGGLAVMDPTGQQLLFPQGMLRNANYLVPSSQMTNHVASLENMVPRLSLQAFAAMSSGTCAKACDSDWAARSERKRRSVPMDSLFCATGPSAAEVFIGSED